MPSFPEKPLAVRAAHVGEYSAIGALLAGVYIGGGFSPPEIDADLRDVEGRSKSGVVLVAVDAAGRVLGTVSFLMSASPEAQIARADEAELRLLAVASEARRLGVGAALVQACVEHAREACAMALVLSTQPSQGPAHRVYERLGFRRQPERDWRTANGGQRLVYVFPLD